MTTTLTWIAASTTAWGLGLLLVFRIIPTVARAARTLLRAAPGPALATALILTLLGGPRA
ncbi:hypothetical protein [Streptomyces sp. NPDC047968]|uniref:hypothetical protein n=1 Tax=unclassified Streptomyces TaxID=2593676 RepID=UPI0034473CBC